MIQVDSDESRSQRGHMQATWKLKMRFDLLEWFWSRLAYGWWPVREENPTQGGS
jgi:hypothetical protein